LKQRLRGIILRQEFNRVVENITREFCSKNKLHFIEWENGVEGYTGVFEYQDERIYFDYHDMALDVNVNWYNPKLIIEWYYYEYKGVYVDYLNLYNDKKK
jgi:hypothetical protein